MITHDTTASAPASRKTSAPAPMAWHILLAAAAILAMLAAPAQALTVHHTLESFQRAIVDDHVDDYDDMSPGQQYADSAFRTTRYGDVTYRVSSNGLFVIETQEPARETTGYDKWLSTMDSADLVFRLAIPMPGLGGHFFATLTEGQVAPAALVTVTAVTAGGTTQVLLNSPTDDTFLGLTSHDGESIFELRVHVNEVPGGALGEFLYPTVNDFHLSTMTAAIPEPGTALLMCVGAAAIATRRRWIHAGSCG